MRISIESRAERVHEAVVAVWEVLEPFEEDDSTFEIVSAYLLAFWIDRLMQGVPLDQQAAETERAWAHLRQGVERVRQGVEGQAPKH